MYFIRKLCICMCVVIMLVVKLTLCSLFVQCNAQKRIKVYINSLGYPGGGPKSKKSIKHESFSLLSLIGICNYQMN